MKHINGQVLTPKEGGQLGKGDNQNNNNNNNNKNSGGNNNKPQFQGTCNYCGKSSRKEVDCHRKVADVKDGKQTMRLQQQPFQMEWN